MPIINPSVDNAPKGFDVNAARQAGYSDDEIIQHLASQQKFDAAGAMKAGYSKDELISHLATTPTPKAQSLASKAWDTINTPIADLAFGTGTTADYTLRATTGKSQAQLKAEAHGVDDSPYTLMERLQYNDPFGVHGPSDRAAARTFGKGAASDTADTAAGFTSPLSIALLGTPKLVELAGQSLAKAKVALEGLTAARAAIEGTEGLAEADAAVQQAKTAFLNAQKTYAAVRVGQGAVDTGFAAQGGMTAAEGVQKYRSAKTADEQQAAIQQTLMGGGMGLMGAYGLTKAIRPGAPAPNVRPAEDVPSPMTGAFSPIPSNEGFEPKRGPGVFEPFDQAATPLFHGERLAEPAFLGELGKGKPVKPQSIPGVNPDVDWESMIQHQDPKEGFTAKGSFDPISGEFKMYPEASEAVNTGKIRPEDEPPAPVQAAPEPPTSSGKAPTFNVEKIAPAKAGDSTMHRMSITKEGKEVGHITGIEDPASPGVLQIHDSELTNGERGNGLGTQAYKEFINHAKESGFSTLRSDSIVSPAASRVWEGLKSKGYDVKQVMEGLSGKQYELRLQPEDASAAIPKTDIAPPDISGMLKGPELDAYQSGQLEAEAAKPKDLGAAAIDPEAHAAQVVKDLMEKKPVSLETISTLEKSTGVTLSGKTPERMIHDLNGWRNQKVLERAVKDAKGSKPPDDDPGTTLAMHLNPLTPITQAWTKYVGTPVWDMAKALLYKATPDYVIRKAFEKSYGQPEEYVDAAQSRETKIELGQERANKLGKRMVGELSQEQQQQIGTIINGTATKEQVAAMRKNPALNDAVEAARLARRELDTLGGEAVVQGLLSEETFLKNYGKYMPRLYRQFELSYERLMNQFAQRVPNRIEMSRFKSREDIPENIRLLMGEVKEPGYPVAKGLTQMVHDVETAKLFNRVAQNPKWSFADPNGRDLSGFTKMPKSDRLGVLSERYVQTEIAEDINSMIHISSEGAKVVRGLMSEWKFGKVVANPPTHFRNMFANSVLNWLGGLPPTRVDIYYKALREMQDEGPNFQEAKQLGIMNNTFVRGELETMLDSWNKEPGGLFKKFAKIKQALSKGEVAAALNEIRPSQTALGRKMSDTYQAEEAWFKLAKYLHNKEKGMIPKEAAADATKWLFDYGDVPPWVQHLRQSPLGAPFLTFTYKAVPRVLESAVKAPWRIGAVIGLINYVNSYARKQLGMSQAEEDKVRAELPEKMRGGVGAPNQMLIPWKDKAGRLQFLDLSYTLPWGDIVEQGAGGMSSVTPLMASPLRAAFEIGLNKSAYTKKQIWMDTDTRAERAEKATSYAWQQAVPPLSPGGYGLKKLSDAVMQRPDSQGITPSRPGAIGAAIFGIRINPIDPKLDTKYREIERQQAVKEVVGQARKSLHNQSLNPADRQAARDELRDKLNNLKRSR